MFMLPGLALFYGGLVRRKNVLSTIMHSFFGLALVTIVWVVVGFSLAFAPSVDLPILGVGWVGDLTYALFNGVGARAEHDLRDDHPVRAVRGLPADVRGHHARAHHGRLRRAQEVRGVRDLHDPVVAVHLLAAGPHGLVGGRLAVQARCPRLRGWHRGPYLVGCLGPGRGAHDRLAPQERREDGSA